MGKIRGVGNKKKAPNEVRRTRKETTNSITQIGDDNEYSK